MFKPWNLDMRYSMRFLITAAVAHAQSSKPEDEAQGINMRPRCSYAYACLGLHGAPDGQQPAAELSVIATWS